MYSRKFSFEWDHNFFFFFLYVRPHVSSTFFLILLEKASSIGMMEIQSKTFDRISFKWNGKSGAKLMVRFNCLSTDFSRIKGVKGIPLRVHMDTFLNGHGSSTTTANQDDPQPPMERSFAKIKLFRDKVQRIKTNRISHLV